MLVTRKASELDVVELTEDLPEYELKRGDRGTVVVAFETPDEAYDIEFVDETGTSRFAYAVKPGLIANLDSRAKEAFQHGLELLSLGREAEAERELRQAIEIRPSYLETFHNLIVRTFGHSDQFQILIHAMRLVLKLDNSSEVARSNLAIAYENVGAAQGRAGNLMAAISNFHIALAIGAPEKILLSVRRNLAVAYTLCGSAALDCNDLLAALGYFQMACASDTNDATRHNYAVAWEAMGRFNWIAGRFAEAVYDLQCAIDIGLSSPHVLNNYAVALAGAGDPDRAILLFEQLLMQDPGNSIVQSNLRCLREPTDRTVSGTSLRTEEGGPQFIPLPAIRAQEYRLTT
jgi:tetratricopeptide (TPR) repeat protein